MNNFEPTITIFPKTVVCLGTERVDIYDVPDLLFSMRYLDLAELTRFVADNAKIVNERLNKEKAEALATKPFGGD